MITLIHGDDIISSRNYLYELKQSRKEATVFEGEKMSITDLKQIVEGGFLFSEQKIIIIEELFSKRKATAKDVKELTDYINIHEKEADFIIWEDKELTKTTIASLPKADLRTFKLPQKLFAFLESIKPHQGKLLVNQFHDVISVAPVELVFFMIIRQFRLLLAVATNAAIEESTRLAPWQAQKIAKQAQAFSLDSLKSIYKKIANIDLSQKTGTSSFTLTQAIDILLLDL